MLAQHKCALFGVLPPRYALEKSNYDSVRCHVQVSETRSVFCKASDGQQGGELTASEFFESVLKRQKAASGGPASASSDLPKKVTLDDVSEELRAEILQKLQQQAQLAATSGGEVQLDPSPQAATSQYSRVDWEQLRAERRQQSLTEYTQLKEELTKTTLGVAALCATYCFITLSTETAVSYVVGAAGSILYLQLLYKSIDEVSEDNVPEVFRPRRSGLLGSRRRVTPQESLLRYLEGSRRALTSPRLTIPVALVGLYALLQHVGEGEASDAAFRLEMAPLLLGFFAYKGAALIKAYQDNKDFFTQ